MTVTLTKMIDPAQGADQFSTPNNGYRFVGAVFTLDGVSGTFSDETDHVYATRDGEQLLARFMNARKAKGLPAADAPIANQRTAN